MNGTLNRIYRVVWNATTGVWQVASEMTKSRGKTKSQRSSRRGLAAIGAGSILLLCHAGAWADLPTGGVVSAGNGQITQNGGTMVIDQSSNKMAIDWQSFNVGSGKTVQFNQPSANAIALNRVMGGDPSVIHGAINANGRVFLLNPNGILFGATAKVEVASLLASTLNISNEDFMAGNYRFEGNSGKGIVNQGQIKAADGGFIAMVAAKIENVGSMQVRGGQVAMASGNKVRLDLGGPIKIEIDEAVIDGYIRNAGMIRADGGTVLMTVKTAGEIASMAINNEGIIQARGLEASDGGSIRLLGDGGAVANSGTLDVSAQNGKGGTVEVTSSRVGMLDGAVVDASGAQGGGTILLGGDYQGKNAEVANARMTYIAEQAVIRANSLKQGHGGKIIAWADESTLYFGKIEAKGGSESGNGGFVEVSGKQYLDFQGKVDTSAANGSNGTLLLDPTNLTIGNIASSPWITKPGNTFADFTTNTDPNLAHDFSFLRVDVLLEALANNDITVLSSCDAASCVGNITVIDAITWNSGKALTLDATGGITINAAITSTGAAGIKGGDFNAIARNGDIAVNADITVDGGMATGAGANAGNVNLTAQAGSISLAHGTSISAAGSAAAVGGNANGGTGGNITMSSTTGINLDNGQVLSTGGEAAGSGIDGTGGRIMLTSATGDISQSGGRLAAHELVADAGSAGINLNSGNNSVDKLAAQSTAGNIYFANQDTAGLTVTQVGNVDGVSTGGTGSIELSARNLQIDSDVSSQDGSITITADHGQQSGDFSGVVVNGTDITTQGGDISISGRGGDADGGKQAGVVLADGATVNAGGHGAVSVNGQGGTSIGDNNHGVVIDGGVIASDGGQISIHAAGGTVNSGDVAGNHNHALVFENGGQIGSATGSQAVTITTQVGAGDDSVAYHSDADGGTIHTGSGSLTLQGDTLSTSGPGAVDVHSTGDLTVHSVAGSFDEAFKLSEFKRDFNFNAEGNGLDDVNDLTIGKSGNTAAIVIDEALDLSGKTVTLTGGDISLDKTIAANVLSATASGDITQSEGDIAQSDLGGSFTVQSAQLTSNGGDITLKGVANSAAELAATAVGGTITFDNGDNNLNLNGTLRAEAVHLNARALSQTGGAITAGELEVTTSNGGVTLGQNNNVGTLAIDANGGDVTFNNAGSIGTLTIGAVGGTTGVDSTGAVELKGMRDLKIDEALAAGGNVTINAGSRNIDLGTETADKLSLTDAEIDHISAASLTLKTTGNVTNSADVRASGVSAITITAGQGINRTGNSQLGFENTDSGALTLTSTSTADGQGIGTSASHLVTVGASELTLSSARDIHVDAKTRGGGNANLDKLHITSTSAAASDSSFSVDSTATLNLGRAAAPGWYHADEQGVKGTYTVSLNNTNALDFKFIGNAPIQVNASSIDAASFALQSTHGIKVAGNITGTSGNINLKAGGATGDYIGIDLNGTSIVTADGSIMLDGKGGTGQNTDHYSTESDQFGVRIAGGGTVRATGTGSVDITGRGGSTNGNSTSGIYGGNSDGVVITGANSRVQSASGNIAINGTGGSGSGLASATSDGVVLQAGGAITSTSGSVKLTGAGGSGINGTPSLAITQDSNAASIITSNGLEVISKTSGRVNLTNNNNVGTLAADVTTGFDFDNGGRGNLTIGTVNGRQGISGTSSGEIGLYDIANLTVNESITMQSGTLQIASDTITIADGKTIGNDSAGSTRTVNIDLRGRAGKGQNSSRAISIGAEDVGKLSIINQLLQQVYGANLTLNTTSSIDVLADTTFAHIGSGLTLNGETTTNAADKYLILSATGNSGSINLNGGDIGSDAHAILVRGANKIAVSSSSMFKVKAYTDDTNNTDLIRLSSLSIDSSSGGVAKTYSVESSGLTYATTGNGSSYSVSAIADSAPVSFSFTGNASTTIDASSDTKGGSFNVRATSGDVTVSNGVAINSGSANFRASGSIAFNGTASLNAGGAAELRADGNGGSLTVGSGTLASNGNISIWADDVVLGAGSKLSAQEGHGTVSIDTRADVTSSRTIQVGGASDAAGSLSVTQAELRRIEASKLVVGRNNQSYQTSGTITLAGVDLTATSIAKLDLLSRSGSVVQTGAVKGGALDISLNSGNLTLNNAGNDIDSFKVATNGTVSLRNTGALDVKGVTSTGDDIDVRTSGNLLVSGAVNATAGGTGVNAGGGAVNLESTGGKLTIKADVASNGYSSSGNTAQQGGAITLKGENVELGAGKISSTGSGNSNSTGGNAGTLSITAAVGGTVTLDGVQIDLTGGYGKDGAQGNGRDLAFNNAVLLASLTGSSSPQNATINAGSGNVIFNSTVDGGASVGNNLTISSSKTTGATTRSYGNVTFYQAVGAAREIGGLNVHSVQNVTMGSVKATGALSLTPVANASLGTVNAGSVSINNADGTTTLIGTVSTSGSSGININSKTLHATNAVYNTTGGGNIKLMTKDALTLSNTAAFSSSGNIDLTATDGITIGGGSLTTTGAGIILRSATTLTQDLAISTAGGNVEFLGSLDSSGGAHDLVIAAGTNGNVLFGGAVGAGTNGKLAAVTIDSANNATTSGVFKAASFTQNAGNGTTAVGGAMTLDGAMAFTGNALAINGTLNASAVTVNNAGLFSTGAGSAIAAAGGFVQAGGGAAKLGGAITTTSTSITFASPVTVDGTVALSTGATGNGDIRFAGTLDNAAAQHSGSTTLTAGDGEIVFGGAIGANTALGSLTINSNKDVVLPVSVAANSVSTDAAGATVLQNGTTITTRQGQHYRDAVKLQGDATLASTDNGNITLGGTVDGAHALAVNTAGTTTFGGAVGGANALTSLATNVGGTTVFNGGPVTTTGSQTYGDNVQLGVDTTFTSTGGNAVTFAGTVNSAGDVRALQVNTSGTTTFEGAVGDWQALAGITLSNQAGRLLMNGGSFTTTGEQTYHSGTIILGGNTTLESLNAGAITLGGNVDADICTIASLDVKTQGATVFGGAVGTYRPLWSITTDGAPSASNTVTFNQGTVITLGDQNYGETVILGTDTKLTSLGQGDVTFNGPVRAAVDGQQSLTVDTSGDIVFKGMVGDNGQRLASFDAGQSIDGKVKIDGGDITTSGTQVYRQQVELGNNAILTGTTGTFAVGIDGKAHDLTLRFSGPTELEGSKFVGVHNLTSDGTGVTKVTGTVATSGTQTYDSNVMLAADAVLKSTGAGASGDISLNGTVDGTQALRIETAGVTSFNGVVGGTNALASLTTNVGGSVEINGGSVKTAGAQVYGDAVKLGGNTTLTSTSNGEVRFNGTVDGAHSLAVNTGGTTTFGGAVGGTDALASLTTDGPGNTKINGGSVKTTGAQTYGDGLVLNANTVLASTGSGAITFNGTVNGAHSLAVNTGGATTFNGAVGGITALANLSTDADGEAVINGGLIRTTGAQNYGDTVRVASNATLASTGGADITFEKTVNGPGGLAVNTAGKTVFEEEVGDTTALASLSTDAGGGVEINGGSIKTTGSQVYGDAVKLGTNNTLTSTANGEVRFNGTVDGAHSLAVNTGGTTTFGGAVGGTDALASLTTDGPGNTKINGGSVKTTGAQTYGDGLVLNANTVLASTGSGAITFNGTVNGAHSLAVNTGGATTFNGAVGGITALANLSTDADGEAVINGGLIRTTGAQTFNDGVTVGANTVFSARGPVTFAGTLDGPWDININTRGQTRFGGAVGSTAAVANLSTDGPGTIQIDGPSIATTGSLTFDDPVHVTAPTVITAGKDALFYGDAKIGKELLDITAGGRIQFGRPVDNMKNYLTTLFAVTQQATRPAIMDLSDEVRPAQLSVGNLQVVELALGGESLSSANVTQVMESAVNDTVGRIAVENQTNARTTVVTVNGGVRSLPVDQILEGDAME